MGSREGRGLESGRFSKTMVLEKMTNKTLHVEAVVVGEAGEGAKRSLNSLKFISTSHQ